MEEARERGLLGEVPQVVRAVRAHLGDQRVVRCHARFQCVEGADAASQERDVALRLHEVVCVVCDREGRGCASGIVRGEERVERAEDEHVGVHEQHARVLRQLPRVKLIRRRHAAHERRDAVHDEASTFLSAHRVKLVLQ